ncbi:MAG: hypothetical protein IKC69_05685 [Clostridia bacterium]|nr:hypothetical protein [Clostridia bacterium]
MRGYFENAALILGLVISFGTVLTVTLPALKGKWKKRSSLRERLESLYALVERHVAEDEVRGEEMKLQRAVDLCVLRDLITHTYYQYAEEKRIPVYALEDVTALFELYEKRGGNSYVQSLVRQILEEWEVVS